MNNLKNFLEKYKDILISVGSNFKNEQLYPSNTFRNLGIFSNILYLIEEKYRKYRGLSMIIHGFSASVANEFYTEKTTFRVKPYSQMQKIIQDLEKGDGFYYDDEKQKHEIKDMTIQPKRELTNYISLHALVRIYKNALNI